MVAEGVDSTINKINLTPNWRRKPGLFSVYLEYFSAPKKTTYLSSLFALKLAAVVTHKPPKPQSAASGEAKMSPFSCFRVGILYSTTVVSPKYRRRFPPRSTAAQSTQTPRTKQQS